MSLDDNSDHLSQSLASDFKLRLNSREEEVEHLNICSKLKILSLFYAVLVDSIIYKTKFKTSEYCWNFDWKLR